MQTQPVRIVTPDEYLQIERAAEFKSEYYDGELFAMSGASVAHNVISANTITVLNSQLRQKDCLVFPSDMRLHIPSNGLFTYPDVMVACGGTRFLDEHRDVLLTPLVIVEVLSPSTESYDRGKKFEMYRSIPTLREYVLISQDRVSVEVYRRNERGFWELREAHHLEETLELESLGCTLVLSELYSKVELPAARIIEEGRPGSA